MPNRFGDDEKINARIARLKEAGIPTTLANATADPAVIGPYEEAGVHRAVFWLRQGDVADLERRLDRRAAEVEAYLNR
jgi:hypothetical protein